MERIIKIEWWWVSVFCPLCGSWMSVCQEEGTSGKCYVLALAYLMFSHLRFAGMWSYISAVTSCYLCLLLMMDEMKTKSLKLHQDLETRCSAALHLKSEVISGFHHHVTVSEEQIHSRSLHERSLFQTSLMWKIHSLQCSVQWDGGLGCDWPESSVWEHTCNTPLFTPQMTRRAHRKGPLMRRARADGQ